MSTCTNNVSTSHLVKDYRNLKRELGRQPTCLEYAKACHSISTVAHVLGRPGWRNLLSLVGAKPYSRPGRFTRESVEDCYRRLKAELGRVPTQEEYTKSCCSGTTLFKLFQGSGWSNLLKSVGDYHHCLRKHRLKGPSRTSILSAFRRIQGQLGKKPKYGQFRSLTGYSVKDIKLRFGENAWQTILKSAKTTSWGLSAEHLIKDFLDLQQDLGRRPKMNEYLYNCHTPKVLDRVFGKPGWKNLIAAVGAKALPRDIITASHLLNDYLEIHTHLNRIPTYSDFRRRHYHTMKVIDREFGKPGWGNLIKAALRKMQEDQSKVRTSLS